MIFLLSESRFFFHLIFRNIKASSYGTWSVCFDIMWVKLQDLASNLLRLFTCEFQLWKANGDGESKIPIMFFQDILLSESRFFSSDFSQYNSIKLRDLVCLFWYNVGQVAGLGFKHIEIVYLWNSALESK